MDIKKFITDEEIVSIAENLISIDSHEKEGKVALWINEYLEKEGIYSTIDEVEEDRLNIYSRIKGSSDINGLMFNGHLDTVSGDTMKFDPYKPFIKDGKLYGRGSCDMKGGIASMLAAIVAVKRSGAKLSKGVIFTGVIDEESRSKGAEALLKKNIKAEAVVIGESSDLDVSIMHNGAETMDVIFYGKPAHSSKPKAGISAIRIATEFLRLLYEELEPNIEKRQNALVGSSAICPAIISGGKRVNIVPDECIVTVDRRWLPTETLESIYQEIENIAQIAVDKFGGNFEIKRKKEVMATLGNLAYMIDENRPLVVEALKAVEKVTGVKPKTVGFPAWTDAALLSHYGGMDCINLGPGKIDQPHTNNEHCEIDQLIKATHIYIELIKSMCMD